MPSLDRRSFIVYTSGSLAVLAHQWAVTEPGWFARIAAPGEVDAETGTDSYRLASTRARAEEPAKAG
ncbi:hypothetical protein ABT115_26850 [Streptomyces sp. NPDC001832]|uniref:hypothetical protein n=1 Tax=Streptomyces sp. NPDC001832 TaxID=3154527 RepID=UPI00331F6840